MERSNEKHSKQMTNMAEDMGKLTSGISIIIAKSSSTATKLYTFVSAVISGQPATDKEFQAVTVTVTVTGVNIIIIIIVLQPLLQ